MSTAKRSVGWMVVVNAGAWLVIHMVCAWAVTRLPLRLFNADNRLFRSFGWEREGRWYERVVRIKRWKHLLPDGALLFVGGFAKGRIAAKDSAYLARFAGETCRGETAHWLVAAASPLFFLWNPVWGGVVNVVYAFLANVPCISALRYNRMHIRRIVARRAEKRDGGER